MEPQFRLFGIPVQVNLLFFLVVLLIHPRGGDHPALALAWLVIAFAGVLLHELGHALTARAFGQSPRIALHAMGGVTYWSARSELGAGKRVAISAAGPGVGVVLGLAAWIVQGVAGLTRDEGPAGVVLDYFIWVNLGWGVFNLLPMMPLDGGNILAGGLEGLFGAGGRLAARGVSIAVAVGAAALFLAGGAFLGAALCALFIYTNVHALRMERAARRAALSPAPEPSPPRGPGVG